MMVWLAGTPRAVDWLPAPAEPFMLMLRLYRPKQAVLNRVWIPPGIMQVTPR